MRTKILILSLICLFFISGCKKKLPTSPDIPDTTSLRINYFTANPEGVLPLWPYRTGSGYGASMLSWSVSNASIVILEGPDWKEEVEHVGTKEIAPEHPWAQLPTPTTYTLTASSEITIVIKTVSVRVLAFVRLEDQQFWNPSADVDGVNIFFIRGRVRSIGGETANSVRLKFSLYDSEGNFLTEKYATFYTAASFTGGVLTPPSHPAPHLEIGMEVDLPWWEQADWVCSWVWDENTELLESLNNLVLHYYIMKSLEEYIVITWDN